MSWKKVSPPENPQVGPMKKNPNLTKHKNIRNQHFSNESNLNSFSGRANSHLTGFIWRVFSGREEGVGGLS